MIIESPFGGPNQERNIIYARKAVRHSIYLGERPFASHLLYPGALDEDSKLERMLGIHLGYEFWEEAQRVVFYVDYGISTGMEAAHERAIEAGKRIQLRTLPKTQDYLDILSKEREN